MTHAHGYRPGLTVATLGVGLALTGAATAQARPQPADQANAGLLTGTVDRCINGAEVPAGGVAVGVQGGSASLAHTDSNGVFFVTLPPGTYTVTATTNDGTASRSYVPVEVGTLLDMGILDIGGGVAGCGPDSDVTAPVLPTFTPTSPSVPVVATPSPTPPPPAATAAPAATPTSTPDPPSDSTPAAD